MSAETEAAEEAQGVGPGAILGVSIGFLVLCGGLLVLFGFGTRSVDAREALAGSFELDAFPEGHRLLEVAHLLPGGERVFVVTDGSSAVEPSELEEVASDVPEPEADEPGGEDVEHADDEGVESEEEEDDDYDWTAIEVLSEGTRPARLFLVRYPRARADSVIGSQFRHLHWRELSEIDASGGRAAVDGGELEWAGYAADFVRERQFIEGGRFRDTLRVNLSLGGECWIAYATWPEGHAGSTEPVTELLGSLRPR